MYQLRGFVPINAFTDNTPDKIAVFGELSPLSRSFSRDILWYRVDESPSVTLASFNSDREGKDVKVDVVYQTLILNMSQWLFEQSIAGELSKDTNVLLQALQAQFNNRAKVLDIGEIITNGRYWFPTSITVKALESDNEDNRLKVWYADEFFKREYDLFTHVVAPPFDNIDDFFLPAATVITRIQAINAENHNNQISKYRGDFPETELITTNYDFISPLDPDDAYPVPWSVYDYGLAGLSADAIRDSIVDYILANSKHPIEEWEEIFPDLFTPTEFYIIPYWDRYSLPDNQLQAGFYSPTVPLRSQLKTGKKYAFGTAYTDKFLQDNLAVSGNLYRSLQFLSIGHPKNRHAPTKFEELWPKYALISTTSIDFGRIDPLTREFMFRLTELLKAAEIATPYTEIPKGMTRVNRNGVIYMTTVFNRVQYVIPAKQNFVSE
jgi:hypothetical protein